MISQRTLDKFYVINVNTSTLRWEYVKSQMEGTGVDYTRYPAVIGLDINVTNLSTNQTYTGKYMKDNKIRAYGDFSIDCTPGVAGSITYTMHNHYSGLVVGELGLWCSNLSLWQGALALGYDNVVVCEDDFVIKEKSTFKHKLDTFISELPSTYDVAYFTIQKVQGRAKLLKDSTSVMSLNKNFRGWGASMMVYSKKGMEKLLAHKDYSSNGDIEYLSRSLTEPLHSGEYLETYISTYGNQFMFSDLPSEMGR
jgi:GR25 family glycosyltransferase involved in LPS biosynthesis